jgi:hypothetical protein
VRSRGDGNSAARFHGFGATVGDRRRRTGSAGGGGCSRLRRRPGTRNRTASCGAGHDVCSPGHRVDCWRRFRTCRRRKPGPDTRPCRTASSSGSVERSSAACYDGATRHAVDCTGVDGEFRCVGRGGRTDSCGGAGRGSAGPEPGRGSRGSAGSERGASGKRCGHGDPLRRSERSARHCGCDRARSFG